MNSGSADSLKVSARWGLSSKVRQIRPIVDLDRPDRLAIEARDQCVAFLGVSSNVATTTASTCSTVIEGGRPGRGSSPNPPTRAAPNRARPSPPPPPGGQHPPPAPCRPSPASPADRPPLACCPHHPRTPARCASATPTPAPTSPAATSALADRARPGSRSTAPSAVLSSPCANPTTYPTDLWRRTLAGGP